MFGEAEVLVGDEDTQPLETPVIAPVKTKNFELIEKALPATTFDYRWGEIGCWCGWWACVCVCASAYVSGDVQFVCALMCNLGLT